MLRKCQFHYADLQYFSYLRCQMSTFSDTILRWFAANGRDLPWRRTRDPYLIWLSEVILQQTRIDQGRAYWERFVERWPRVELLAAASEDEVLRLWQGLGYYSRARNLHAAAKDIVARGAFPTTFDEIRTLKGVGNYTAAAIASFAFGEPQAVVDGNVYRVLARYEGIDTPIDTTQGKHLFAAVAQVHIPHDRAADYNQAIMDFGALQCTPQSPACAGCPLQESCVAFREKRTAQLPVKSKRTAQRERHFTYVFIRLKQGGERGEQFLAMHRRDKGDIWQGLWEPLLVEDSALPSISGQWTLLKKDMKHVLTHQIIFASAYLVDVADATALPEGCQWVSLNQVESLGKPRLVERLMDLLPE